MFSSFDTKVATYHQSTSGAMTETNTTVLPLIQELCRALAQEEIAYCHWKSNDVLERSASGKNDLDFLIARGDSDRFTEILYRLRFKAALASAEHEMPSVSDYYGYDDASGLLVHVHAHYQLIAGQDMTKNYRLPIEEAYLASSVQGSLFKTPSLDFQIIVFVIRMILKHCTWDTILLRLSALSRAERRELAYLQSGSDQVQVHALLKEHLPQISSALFECCMQALQPSSSLWQRVRAGHELQKALRSTSRSSYLTDVSLKMLRRISWGVRSRLAIQTSQRRLLNGGAIIAIVGGDGAGKTSLVEGLNSWLAGDLQVTKVHLGKPKWSRTTKLVRGVLKIGRLLSGQPFVDQATIQHTPDADPSDFTIYTLALRAVCLARDRYWAYVKAQRCATNGSLVVCDRFPLQQITVMEAPQIESVLHGKPANRLLRYLIQLEKSYCKSFAAPEVLIILKIDPEIAVQRRFDEDPVPVRRRNQEIWTSAWAGSHANVLDASRPQHEVLVEAKRIVWSKL